MTAHTPGPWKVTGPWVYVPVSKHWHITSDDQAVAEVPTAWTNADADIRLIAAAQELLEALEAACDSVAPDRFGDGRPAWYDSARAAIAKARGGA